MSNLPVREMVLYKHGVGFFVREGRIEGSTAELTFRQDEINDVLKSLAVFDRGGGQVLGIHYQTPMDTAARLANTSIRLSDQNSLRDLLRDLRGRQASLTVETTPGTRETVSGRVVGVDLPGNYPNAVMLDATDPMHGARVLVLEETGQVRVVEFTGLCDVTVHDPQSQHDLSYFLDTAMREDTRRTVTVRLSEGRHHLVVNYVAPCPTWRVSYRLVAETDEDGASGQALLQGWGLFDNRLEEDLDDVRVMLVAGQPISFIYDLYESRIPKRHMIKDTSRIAAGPVEFDAEAEELAEAPARRQVAGGSLLRRIDRHSEVGRSERAVRRAMSPPAQAAPEPQAYRASRAEVAESVQTAAEGKAEGEFFQYVVTTPVSVKRGQSALVPIIGATVSYHRELLYNRQKFKDHPVVALRFSNSTGLTLERGPVTVVEDTDYKGEAVVPFTKDAGEVYLAFAVELGVRVTEQTKTERRTVGLNIEDEFVRVEAYLEETTSYRIQNTTLDPQTVTVEAPLRAEYELFNMPDSDVETLKERRWRVNVPAKARTTFIRRERKLLYQMVRLETLDYRQLNAWFQDKLLADVLYDELRGLLDHLAKIEAAKQECVALEAERGAIYAEQEQLRANLGALQPTGQEAALRNRILGQLEATQDRLEDIAGRLKELTRQIEEDEARTAQIIAALGQTDGGV